jgi:hypothetical protein
MMELRRPQVVKNARGQLYQGGYLDFMRRDFSNIEGVRGPPRSGLLDDLCYYIKDILMAAQPPQMVPKESRLPGCNLESPDFVSVLVQKLVASEYMKLLDYFEGILRKLRDSEWRLAGMGDYSDHRRGAAQEQWGSLHVCSHRLAEHVDDVEAILLGLNIPLLPPQSNVDDSWLAIERDFQYIYHRLKTFKARTDHLVTSTIGLAGIVGNKQALREAELSLKEARRSIREAKSVKTLTFIAMFFIPLAWTSGIFSMSDQFSPGAKHFWIYFAVSMPLVIIVFVLAGFMQLGYDDSADWSFKTFKKSFARILEKNVVEEKVLDTPKRRAATANSSQNP